LEEKKKRNEIQQIKNEIVELKETYQTEKKSYEEMDKTRVEVRPLTFGHNFHVYYHFNGLLLIKKNAEERERLEAAVSEVHTEEAQIDSEREGQDSKMKELRVGIERKQKSVNSVKFLGFFWK
jgi:hypothetical protein